jgi:cytochrome c biogenesis protein ResB
MAVGLGTAFYLVHMRVWVVPVRNARGSLILWAGGTANKNREAFQDKFAEIVGNIQAELKQAGNAGESTPRAEEHATTLAGD